MNYYLPPQKWLARTIHLIASALSPSSFKDVAQEGYEDEYCGIKIAAPDFSDIERIKAILMEVTVKSINSEKLVLRWIKHVICMDTPKRWKNHFCDGTVFIWSKDQLPNNVLASYLYRWSVEICLYNRFGHVEVVTGDPRCLLISDRFQLRLMKALGCDDIYTEQINEAMLKRKDHCKLNRIK